MTYFVKVSSVEGNPELKSVDVVVDGVVRPGKKLQNMMQMITASS